MKVAQELRAGNVVTMNGNLQLITKAEFSKSGRNSSVMKLKFRNLISGSPGEGIYKADEKFDDVILDRRDVTYSYNSGEEYVFVDGEYNQYELKGEMVEGAVKYLYEAMPCELVIYDGKPLSIEIPIKVVHEVTYTEPAVKGDTSGKVMKPATIGTGHVVSVPGFVEIGDKIEIDTRTDEYTSRAK